MWGFHTVRGNNDPGGRRVRPGVVGIVDAWKDLRYGIKSLSSSGTARRQRYLERQFSQRAGSVTPSQSATDERGWRFHTVRDGIDPGDRCFGPRIVGVVDL